MFRGLAGLNGWGDVYPMVGSSLLNWGIGLIGVALVFFARNTWEISWKPRAGLLVALVMLFLLCVGVFLVNTSSPFLYFQF